MSYPSRVGIAVLLGIVASSYRQTSKVQAVYVDFEEEATASLKEKWELGEPLHRPAPQFLSGGIECS